MSRRLVNREENLIPIQLFSIGFSVLLFVFGTILITSILFFVGGRVSYVWPILSFIGMAALTYFYLKYKGFSIRRIIITLAITFGIIGSCIALATSFYDSSYDGDSYHKVAVGSLKNGWNPVYQDASEFNKHQGDHIIVGAKGLDDEGTNQMWVWINHYPKGGWVFAASIYSLTGNIESGKAMSFLTIIATFLIALAFFYRRLGKNKALIVALLLAVNPIIVMQAFGYYNDGILGNLLILLFIFFAYLMRGDTLRRVDTWVYFAGIVTAIVLASGLKFTGLAYAGIVGVCYFTYFLIKKDWQIVKKLSIVGGVALVISIGIVGASSYASNTISHKNPFYPLAGEGSVDIVSVQQPDSFAHKNRIKTFLESNFSATFLPQYVDPKIKVPFSITPDEVASLHDKFPDVRIAGYGVWFGGALIVSFFVSIYLLIRHKIYRKDYFWAACIPIGSVAITILVFDTAWWARYLPQLIIVPVILVAIMFELRLKMMPYILSFILLFNITLTSMLVIDFQTRYTQDVRTAFATHLKCDSNTAPEIWSSGLLGNLYNAWDVCSGAKTVPIGLVKSVPEERRVNLYAGLYIILPPPDTTP